MVNPVIIAEPYLHRVNINDSQYKKSLQKKKIYFARVHIHLSLGNSQ